MGRRAKPAKARVEAKLPVARKSLKSENARVHDLEKRLAEALEQQTATAEILRAISTSQTDVQRVFDVIVPNATKLCAADIGAVVLVEDGQLVQRGVVAIAELAEVARRSFPRPVDVTSLTGRCVVERRVIHIPNFDDPSAPRGLGLQKFFRSQLLVPMLRGDGDPVGAITVMRKQPSPFSDSQIGLLQTFANQAVIALENVRLFTELQEKNRALTQAHAQTTEALEQQTATAEILQVIASSPTDLQPVLDAVAESAARLCDAHDASILRVEGDALQAVATYGTLPAQATRRGFQLPINRASVAGRAVVDGQTIHVHDLAAEVEREFPVSVTYQRSEGVRTILATPLLREGVPIGAIVILRSEVRPFADKQVALLKTFSNQAVIAIENVRLFNELEGRNRDLAQTLDQQTATGEILRVISGAHTDAQPVFDTIVRSTVRLCNAAMAAVFLTDGRMLHNPAGYGSSPEALAAMRARYPLPLDMDSSAGIAILTRSVAQVPDIEDPSAPEVTRHAGRLLGFRSMVTVPMLRGGELIGALGVTRRQPGQFSDGEVMLLKTFADQAVIAIENVRLFTELQEKNKGLTVAHAQVTEALEQQTATSEVLRVISRSQTDIQPVFAAILDSAVRLCGADTGGICRILDGQLVLVAFNPSTPENWAVMRESYPRPVDRTSLTGRAVVEARVVHVPDIEHPEALPGLTSVAKGIGFRSHLSMPILRGGQPIGVLALQRRMPGPFTEAQIELVQTFADQAVIAIENVRLLAELQARTAALTRSVDQLTALGEVGQAVSSSLELETVLTTIVSRAVQLSGLDGGVIFEYDEAAEEFAQRAATDPAGALPEARRTARIGKGEGVVGRTAVTLGPAQVPDITVAGAYEGRLRETLIEAGVRAVLAVPMLREGHLIGCLAVTRNAPGDFPPETMELLRTFATQSALAIQNARLFREIADKSRQLEVASQHKSEFLANMSHELRTPLNAIIGFSEVLTDRMFGELNEKQEEYLKDIYASGTHLLSLINDILDLSKIEAGRMELELTDFHLPTALDNALTLVRERAGRRSITLQMSVDERLGQIQADERKIRQVVLNLLSNAIKFTPEGGRIEVAAGPKDGFVEVVVSDTGVGIAPEDQEAVFEEFRQVGTAEKKAEGTGLGLTLCRKFIELHGGRIWVRSQEGVGSTFTFTIPIRWEE